MKPSPSPSRSPLVWPPVIFVGFLLLVPLAGLARLSFMSRGPEGGRVFYEPGTWSLEVWKSLASDRYFGDIVGFTLFLGLSVTMICLLLGYPLALAIYHAPRRWKPWLLAGIIVPKLSNLLITIYGLKFILGDHGPVNHFLISAGLLTEALPLQNNLAGVMIGKTILVLPYTALFLWIGLEKIDRSLHSAASGLGASPWDTFRLVTLPLSHPAIYAATLISLVWSCGAYISPYLLGSPEEITIAVDVQRQLFENQNWPRAAAEGLVLIGILLGLVAIGGAAANGKSLFARLRDPLR